MVCALFLAVLCLKAVSMPLTFDEYFHAHYLWLIAIGRVPHVDFWCGYLTLGYVLVRPFFQLFPESIDTVIALRLFGLCFFIGMATVLVFHARRLGVHWLWCALPPALMATPEITPFIVNFRTDAYAALAAILAIALMFREPSPVRSAAAMGFSVFSVLIMPKYVYPLTFAAMAYLVYGFMRGESDKRRFFLSALLGGCGALAISQALLLTSGVWLWSDVYWSPLFMQKFFAHAARTDPSLTPQWGTVVFYFSKYPFTALLVLAGVSGWLVTEWRQRGVRLWVGMAVLAGQAVFWGTWRAQFLQFFVPGLFCLALFVPYAGLLLKGPFFQPAGAGMLLIASALMVGTTGRAVLREYASGAAAADFEARGELLKMISRSERVIGIFKTHPCFREDQTFVTYDEYWGTPRGFVPVLPKNSRTFSLFQPDYLQYSLEHSRPPASIALHTANYPPGWNEVLLHYLMQHSALYDRAEFLGKTIFIRKDLIKPRG
jgi:hypothetical protein